MTNLDRFCATDAQFARIELHLPSDTRGEPSVNDLTQLMPFLRCSVLPADTLTRVND